MRIPTIIVCAAVCGAVAAPPEDADSARPNDARAPVSNWRDDFPGPRLNPRWTWETPLPGPSLSFSERPGRLRMRIPQRPGGYNHWTDARNAAFLRTAVPKRTYWDFSAGIDLARFSPDSNFHLALVVGFDDGTVLAWGPFLSRSLYPKWPRPTLWAEPTGSGAYIQTRAPVKNVELRISRRVNTYRMAWRPAGTKKGWTEAGCWYGGGLTPRFIGFMGKTFGDGPGVALDIDYAAFAVVPAPRPRPPIEAAAAVNATRVYPVPPLQRGFFLEFLGHCIFRGLWDERLVNRKFIGESTKTGVVWGWEPYGKARGYAPDPDRPLAEPQSQRMDLGEERGGIVQYGLELTRHRTMRVRVNLCASGNARNLQAALIDRATGRILARAVLLPQTLPETWKAVEADLTPAADSSDAGLAVTATGPGTVWLGAVSLMAADNIGGFRREVVERMRKIRIPVLRWPGGNMASGYHWRDGIGPRDRRPTRWDRAWKAWVYNDMGTDEFLDLCRLIGAEPCICVNAGEGTAEEAAAWVEYCNGPPDSLMGRIRARNGHSAPWRVRWWDVGNEIWGPWQLGHVDAGVYGFRAVEFARAMRRADRSIRLVASGVLEHDFGDWNARMLPICGRFMDALSVHDYVDYDATRCTDQVWARVTGAPLRIERRLLATFDLGAEAAGKPLPLIFDEWNTIPHKARGWHGLPDALYAAGVLIGLQRCGGKVPMANYALLVNPIGALRVTQTRVLETPVFLVFRLFERHSGPLGIPVDVTSPAFHDVPVLDAAASLDEQKSRLHLVIVNRHPRRDVRVRLDLSGLRISGDGTLSILRGDEPWARNTFENPEQVSLTSRALPAASLRTPVVVPAASVVGLSLPCTMGETSE